MTPDEAIWWLKLKAKQKQKEGAPIFQGGTLPVTDITAEPIGKGKYLAEFDKQNPRQEYKETNEYIRRFQPEKVVQKQAWRDVERNRLRDNYAESYMIRDKDLKMQQEYEKNKQNLPWWQKRVEGVNTTPQQKEQILEQQAKGRLDWSNKPLEHKAGWIASETAMALVPELFFLKGTGKGAQIAKNLSNTASDIPTSSVINKTDDIAKPITSYVDDVGKRHAIRKTQSTSNLNNLTLGNIDVNKSSINTNTIIERQIKLSDNPPFLDDLATRTRHGKTKIGHNIVDNIPKKDKLIMTQQSGDLIHRTKLGEFNNGWHINEEGRLFKLNSGSEKKSFHFSGAGKQVKSHSVGTWDDDATTIITPFNSFGNYNGFPRSTAINDVYWWNPRQLEFPQSTKIFTGDMELASHLKKSNLKDVVFSPDIYKIQQKMKKVERFSDEWTKLAKENKKLHDDFISQSNAQPISGLDKNIDLGIRETIQKRNNTFDAELFDKRNLRSFNESPYVHDEDRLLKEQWSSGDKKHKLKFDIYEKKAAEHYNEMTKINIDNKNWEDLNDWKDVMAKEDGRLSHTDKIIIQQQALNTKNKGVLTEIANEINNKLYLTERDRFIVTAIREKLKTGKPIYTYGIGGALLLNGTSISELSKVKNK